ncbi:hypothetical protein PISMIDRAFT_682837 [Pisolithus microcarpus 441]|uniref:Uncharacterized protein n=1 Tax=Pisolithus microcarpus 441 TaxID=765257 RepID=A0A0C9YSI5_9AGAM|nr:hypothetical protein PISMIDRAFT_682837 [Pisolithus microcarpus 441]
MSNLYLMRRLMGTRLGIRGFIAKSTCTGSLRIARGRPMTSTTFLTSLARRLTHSSSSATLAP